MKNKKRMLAVILVLSICLSLCGCGAQAQNNKELKGDPALSAPPYYLELKAAEGKTWEEFFTAIGMKDQMIRQTRVGADGSEIVEQLTFPEKVSYLGYDFDCKVNVVSRGEHLGEMTLIGYIMTCEFDDAEEFGKVAEDYLRIYYELAEKLTAIYGNSFGYTDKSLGDTFEDALFRFKTGGMPARKSWLPANKDDVSVSVGIYPTKFQQSYVTHLNLGIEFALPYGIEAEIEALNKISRK